MTRYQKPFRPNYSTPQHVPFQDQEPARLQLRTKSYRRDVVKNIEVYGEMHRYIPYLAKNAGFPKIAEKVVHHQARKFGKTKIRRIKPFLQWLSRPHYSVVFIQIRYQADALLRVYGIIDVYSWFHFRHYHRSEQTICLVTWFTLYINY